MKKVFGYSAYTIGSLIFFLVVLFPSEQAAHYVQGRLSKALSKDVTLASVAPAGLAKINVEKPGIRDKGEYVVRADHLLVDPSLLSLIRKKPDVDFSVKAYGGEADITLESMDDAKGVNGPYSGTLNFSKIQVDDIEGLSRIPEPGMVSGSLKGDFTFSNLSENIKNLEGEGGITLSDGKMILWSGLAAGLELPYDEIHMELSLKKRKITIEKCALKGDLVRGSFSGTIRLGSNTSKSRVNVTGTLEPTRSFFESSMGQMASRFLGKKKPGDSIPFSVTGPLSDLQFMPK